MGHKNVCFKCRKSQNLGSNFDNIRKSKCPECGVIMKLMPHRFRPPKKQDEKKWEVVKYLVSEGFEYQHILDDEIINTYVPYPETMNQAKEFVEKYKNQRVKS